MKKDDYQLCYVDGNIMYFSDNFKNQWGDDWDDAPYEYNADPPYEFDPTRDENSGSGRLILAAYFDKAYDITLPCTNYCNSPYSVRDINLGTVPWLSRRGCGGLMGGATLADAREFCRKNGILFGVLEDLSESKKPKAKKDPKNKRG